MDKYLFETLQKEFADKLAELLHGERIPVDVIDAGTGEILIPANRIIKMFMLRKVAAAELQRVGTDIDPSPIRSRLNQLFDQFAAEKKITLRPLI